MAKSKEWYLIRLGEYGEDEKYFLNIDRPTRIGRNKSADIITNSDYCSRNHCAIMLETTGVIRITDLSSNGTIVNELRLEKKSTLLKLNDLIGLGCSVHVFHLNLPDLEKYFVFKLKNINPPTEPEVFVDLVADSDSTEGMETNDVKDANEPQDVKDILEPKNIAQMANGLPNCDGECSKLADNDRANCVSVNGLNVKHEVKCEIDDIEIEYSQRYNREIKKEVIESYSGIDDFKAENRSEIEYHIYNLEPIVIEDDEEEENENLSNWMGKLSQNQDKVVEKVSSSIADNKRKSAKLIDSMPAPKRRKSVNEREKVPPRRKSTSEENQQSSSSRRRKSTNEREKDHKSSKINRKKSTNEREENLELSKSKRRQSTDVRERIEACLMPKRRMSTAARYFNGFTIPHRRDSENYAEERKAIAEDRKAKLFEIAQNQIVAKKTSKNEKNLHSTTPKVKVSESRGQFLLEPVAACIDKRRRSSTKNCTSSKCTVSSPTKTGKPFANHKELSMLTKPSTSKDEAVAKERVKANLNVDPLDPFAIELKNRSKPRTLGDALAQIDKVSEHRLNFYTERANRSDCTLKQMPYAQQQESKKRSKCAKPKSCIRPLRRHKGLTVSFCEKIADVKLFEPGENEDNEFLINCVRNLSDLAQVIKRSEFQTDPLHKIITDITEWDPNWLQSSNTPPINGVNFVVGPLVDAYPSFDQYQRIVTPLLKHELWASIQSEAGGKNRIRVTINDMNAEQRGVTKRCVFHCQITVDGNNSKLFHGDFVLVELVTVTEDQTEKKQNNDQSKTESHETDNPETERKNGENSKQNRKKTAMKTETTIFFAYLTEHRYTRSGYNKTTYFSMEAAKSVVNFDEEILRNPLTTVFVTPVANIRTELKLFSSVFYLKDSPLQQIILDPMCYVDTLVPNHSPNFKYGGHEKLNQQQMEILEGIYNKCLHLRPSLSLIEGPPGTGKSRLIVALILQLIFGTEMRKMLKILVCASSNAAVDIITRKLLHIRSKISTPANIEKQHMLSIIRFGVVNSMHPDVRGIAPQTLIKRISQNISDQSEDMQTLIAQKESLTSKINYMKQNAGFMKSSLADKIQKHQKNLAHVNETIKKRTVLDNEKHEQQQTRELLKGARIVCSTLSSSINLKEYVEKFDVCIIDEASQCTEPWSMVPLQYNVSSLILVGDSNQLSPVVLSPICKDNCLDKSLFARLQEVFTTCNKTSNTYSMHEQYRMHPEICNWSNAYFYQNRLTSSPSTVDNGFKLRPYNVFNLDFTQSNNDTVNYYNIDEAKFVVHLLKIVFQHANPKKFSYGVITPYAMQKTELLKHLSKSKSLSSHAIPVNTIDSYQGQEKDIIILSSTRTTGVGFLANPQRLNVALTRAKKCLIICGNFESVSKNRIWSSLLTNAEYRKCLHNIPRQYKLDDLAKLLLK